MTKNLKSEIRNLEDFGKVEQPKEPKQTETVLVDKVSQMKQSFTDEQRYWCERIENHSQSFSSIKALAECQILIYSDRQKILEQKSKLVSAKISLNKTMRVKKKEAYIRARTESDLLLKYNNEINLFIESDLSEYLTRLEILEMQISFLEDTIRTVDNIIYGIKNRIQMEEMLNGI